MDNPIVELRSRLGISQEEAAMLLGISRGHLSKIEIGQVAPRGLSEVYLIQALRLLDLMEEPVLPEITEPGLPAFAQKELQRLEARKKNIEKELEKLAARQKAVLRLKAFIPLLAHTKDFENRKIGILLARFQRNIQMEEESYGSKVCKELFAELAYINAQIQYLTGIHAGG